MISVEEALELVLRYTEPVEAESVTLAQAEDRIASQDLRALAPFPPFRASMKDGYAVMAADGPGVYPVVGQIMAGHPAQYVQKAGEVSYITTGAPLPEGADAVVMVEDTVPQGNQVRIQAAVQAGSDVRPIGSDLAEGTQILTRGRKLGAMELGMLAMADIFHVPVFRKPRVTVMSTGDELSAPWEELTYGQIRDANHITLSRLVMRMGAESVGGTEIAPDDPARLRREVERNLEERDILVTSGGVSMGEYDLLPEILRGLGATIHTERVIMKPGKPFTFSTMPVGANGRSTLVFSLPGNPVSAIVTFLLFVVPALRKMQGHAPHRLPVMGVTLTEPMPRDRSRPEYHRVSLLWDQTLHGGIGGYRAASTGSQASSRLLSMLHADALVEIPQGEGHVASGTVLPAVDLRLL